MSAWILSISLFISQLFKLCAIPLEGCLVVAVFITDISHSTTLTQNFFPLSRLYICTRWKLSQSGPWKILCSPREMNVTFPTSFCLWPPCNQYWVVFNSTYWVVERNVIECLFTSWAELFPVGYTSQWLMEHVEDRVGIQNNNIPSPAHFRKHFNFFNES